MYHIHIDATEFPESLRKPIEKIGFKETNFIGHPEGYQHFEPNHHFTFKTASNQEFDVIWKKLSETLQNSGFIGYIEGEFVKSHEIETKKPYYSIPVPFFISRRRLSSKKNEKFRQTEIHLTIDKDQSHPELIKKMLDSGMYGAYLPKSNYIGIVLTCQGYVKDVTPLLQSLKTFLQESGGYANAKLKEERAIRHELFGISVEMLPEIVDTVKYHA